MPFGSARCLRGISVLPLFWLILSIVDVQWTTPSQDALNISALGRAPEILECLEESRKAKLRFEVRLCRRRSGWIDFCEEPRNELHTVTYDEVTESYRVVSDRLNDEQEPIAIEVPSRSEAVRLVVSLERLPLKFLMREELDIVQHSKAYVQVRTAFTCRGNSSRPFAHISRILTFGILNSVEDQSEWDDFPLHQSPEAAQ
jgi:hypothetical protein